MTKKRKLNLNRQTIRNLDADDLKGLAGAGDTCWLGCSLICKSYIPNRPACKRKAAFVAG